MVNTGKIDSALFAFGLVGRCLADYNGTTQTVTYVPIVEEYADYLWLYSNIGISAKRTAIETTVEAASVITAATSIIIAANSALGIYECIADVIESKPNSNSCSMHILSWRHLDWPLASYCRAD
ncbi:uncharacterized protein N7518_006325 [Penicillium psychrosexuale]|uniref:uncharacterized protein n=1 Tax=Penicillium psychrosexuale TaxID=1002107 RepID=UPI0025455776|nr:uncharacterized protein N7518_006325 [Penicillium psychrosexuale]KAJ5789314.1 hypothetical protein N7518_006325 [Penicillium psychrosexuale]